MVPHTVLQNPSPSRWDLVHPTDIALQRGVENVNDTFAGLRIALVPTPRATHTADLFICDRGLSMRGRLSAHATAPPSMRAVRLAGKSPLNVLLIVLLHKERQGIFVPERLDLLWLSGRHHPSSAPSIDTYQCVETQAFPGSTNRSCTLCRSGKYFRGLPSVARGSFDTESRCARDIHITRQSQLLGRVRAYRLFSNTTNRGSSHFAAIFHV